MRRKITGAAVSLNFYNEVYRLVAQIPFGSVATYGQLAIMLGSPHGARAVGWAMRRCPNELPWQRVVRADGSIAGGSCRERRIELLKAEGIPFLTDGLVDLSSCRWRSATGHVKWLKSCLLPQLDDK